jgi:hypothetical protein
MLTCDICSKEFRRRDNMLRHKKTIHDQKEEEEDESEQSDSESTFPVSEESDTDSDASVDAEDENEEVVPWQSIVEKAFDKCQHLYEEQVQKLKQRQVEDSDARQQAYEDMRTTYRKAIMNIFMNRMVWFTAMQQDSIYKTIKKTAGDLKILDNY